MPAKKRTKKAVKKSAAKKAPAKKKTVAKKSAVKAPAAKTPTKTAPKKAAKKVTKTTIVAQVDVGFGNTLYIRGEGDGLSWDKGVAMENVSPYEWAFVSSQSSGQVTYKFLINDEGWADGENETVAAGTRVVNSPIFSW